jgi:hypothetical protein
LLVPHPTPKVDDYPFLAVRNCLFNIAYWQLPPYPEAVSLLLLLLLSSSSVLVVMVVVVVALVK